MPKPHPSLPSPAPHTGLDSGSWAESTVKIRFGEIAQRTLSENQFPPDVAARYHALISEIHSGVIRLLDEPLAPDQAAWRRYTAPYLGRTWLEVPWFFSENYFYRRILEATGFYQPGPLSGFDPFKIQKRLGLDASKEAILDLRDKVDRLQLKGDHSSSLKMLLLTDLWGNRADLSLWPAGPNSDTGDITQSDSFLLADDTDEAVEIMLAPSDSPRRIDLVADNAGFEFVVDLVLGDYLLASSLADELHIHLKAHPTFVSDATMDDFEATLHFFQERQRPQLKAMAARLIQALADGRMHLKVDSYWTSPLPAWELPENLRAEFSQSGMVIFKGDANYRRLLGDLHWPFHTPFSMIMEYFPTAVCALRTLKSEIATDLQPEQVRHLETKDPEWKVNGRWGVIQIGGSAASSG